MNTSILDRTRQDRSALEAELRQAGADIRGNAVKCPFHDDRHASGSIYSDESGVWRYRCQAQSCGAAGDVFDLRHRVSGKPLADVLKDANPTAAAGNKPREAVYANLDDLRAAVGKGGVIEAEYSYSDPDAGKVELLVFRLRTMGGKAFRQCHLTAAGWVQRAPGKPWPLYRRAEIRDAENVVVVEGEKCVEALLSIGIAATTSPCGAGKADHADWGPLAGKQVWLWPDNDEPGRNHIRQVLAILDKLSPAPTIRVIEPNDIDLAEKEDAFDLIAQCRAAGADPKQAVLDVMAKAKSCSLSSGLRDRIENTISGKWADVPWPWERLTKLSRALLPQTVTILCGTPGAAKSFLVFKALLHWFDAGIGVACLALEEDRTYHLQRVLALLECNIELLDPDWQKANPDEIRAAYAKHQSYLDRFGKRLWDAPVEAMTLDGISAWIRDRARDGCRVMIVDPVTAAAASEKTWVADSKFVNDVKAIMRSHDASLLLVTHPKKGSKLAGLDDLAGGAVYQRLSQCILWLERYKTQKRVTVAGDCGRFAVDIDNALHICKARNGRGHGLSLGFKIDWPTLSFAEQGIIVGEHREKESSDE
jgi:KaiC/GvpD/RAD55 family RecA-like ATPase